MAARVKDSGKRVGIWIRVSTEDQVRGESPETHERRARLYAEAKGWNVVEVYRLDAISGKTVKDLPEAKRMLEDVRAGHITGLIFSKLARLARNTRELLEFSEIFRECNADLVSLAESIDTSTPAGRLFYTMIAAMAQWEREEIAERVAASVPVRAKMGKILGGRTPFGYQKRDGKLVPDPKEAPVRKLVYELYKELRRKRTVARELNARGYRTRTGDQFTDSTVGRLISDPIGKGTRRVNYTKAGAKNGSWVLKPEKDWVMQEVEPIVSEELWNECNAMLAEQMEKGKRKSKRAVHLFAGLTYCSCGGKMYVYTSSPTKYLCQECRNKIPIADLEAVFHEQLKNFFFSPNEIASHLEEANEAIRQKAELLTSREAERAKLQGEIDKLHALYQAGAIDSAGFGTKYHPMAERLRQIDEELPALQAELDVMKISELSREEVIVGAQDLYTRWTSLPFEERRRVVETITDRIVISDGEVEIQLSYAPPIPPRRGGGSDGAPDDSDGGNPPLSSPVGNHGKSAAQQCGLAYPCGRRRRSVSRQRWPG